MVINLENCLLNSKPICPNYDEDLHLIGLAFISNQKFAVQAESDDLLDLEWSDHKWFDGTQ